MESSLLGDDSDSDLIIDPTLTSGSQDNFTLTSQDYLTVTSQDDPTDDANSSASFVPGQKRKADTWIHKHGRLECVGKKKYWKCFYCKALYTKITS